MNEALSKFGSNDETHIGVVTDVVDGLITINSHTRIANVQVLNGFGVSSMPYVGQEVLVMSTKTGEYICVGDASAKTTLQENETILSSLGGGYVKLMADGSVVINGLTITKTGQIIPAIT